MAEVDTSSYPRPQAPPNMLDQAAKLGSLKQQSQQIESGALTIDKQKLDLVNQRFGEMSKGFVGLIKKPDLTANDVNLYVDNQVKLGYIPAEMAATIKSQLPADGDPNKIRAKLEQDLSHAQTTVEAINWHYGQNAEQSDQANTYSGVRAPVNKGGGFTAATVTPLQLPPTTPIQGPQGQPGFVGAPAAGPRPYAPPAVAAPPPVPAARPSGAGLRANVAPPVASGPSGPTVAKGTEFNDRFSAAFPNAVAAGPSPGTGQAVAEVAVQSGKDMATDLARAKNFQADIYPSQRVLEIVKEEGTKAFGPGTEGLNALKSALVTWLPNVDQKTIDSVSNFEQAKKYLVQAARSSGSTGTNDQLAAAFEANPNVKMSGATIESVVKSNIALRKMQSAQTLLAAQQGISAGEYSKWIAQNQNVLDPRAFGFDMMDNNAKSKLIEKLKKDKAAYQKFETSLQFAHDAGLIEPPARK